MTRIWIIGRWSCMSVGLALCVAGAAHAECKSDSGEQYRIDVESCNAGYLSPDDAADLRSCIESAYQDFAESYDDCDSTVPFYEEWAQGVSKIWNRMTGWVTAESREQP